MSGFLPLRFTNCKREHHRATSNYEDASLGPMLQRHDAESSSLGPILKRQRAENSRPGPVPKSYHAMHGRRRIRAVRKRNEHFQLVKNYAREQADCSLPLTVPHPPSRQESPPTGWLQQLKRKAILWALHPPCFFRRLFAQSESCATEPPIVVDGFGCKKGRSFLSRAIVRGRTEFAFAKS
jgi:hypothetical protein